jgi:hypothetical protein
LKGVALAGGKYRIVQSLRDTTGHTLTTSSTVALSKKRLITHTAYLYKTARQYSKRASDWIGWQFTLPSATVYKTLSFGVYGKSTVVPASYYGAWDTRLCSFAGGWSPGCANPVKTLGFSLAWYSSSLSTRYNRSGRYVRGFAFASYAGGGAVVRVRLKVVYGVLR